MSSLENLRLRSTSARPATTNVSQQPACVGKFAVIDEEALRVIATAMTDAQCAVLLCLAWDALRQQRMKRGELAGLRVARLSVSRLATLTGCREDCVRRALSKLKKKRLIVARPRGGNETATYTLPLLG